MSNKPEVVSGSALVPDFGALETRDQRNKYWIGALPSCPVNGVHIGDITFHTVVEIVTVTEEGNTIRSPQLGVVTDLTREQIQRIRDQLPRMVIRFTSPRNAPVQDDDPSVGPHTENIGDKPTRARRGGIICIPSPEQAAIARERGRYLPYYPSPLDEPLANHIYCVRAAERGAALPKPVSETGLEVF